MFYDEFVVDDKIIERMIRDMLASKGRLAIANMTKYEFNRAFHQWLEEGGRWRRYDPGLLPVVLPFGA